MGLCSISVRKMESDHEKSWKLTWRLLPAKLELRFGYYHLWLDLSISIEVRTEKAWFFMKLLSLAEMKFLLHIDGFIIFESVWLFNKIYGFEGVNPKLSLWDLYSWFLIKSYGAWKKSRSQIFMNGRNLVSSVWRSVSKTMWQNWIFVW